MRLSASNSTIAKLLTIVTDQLLSKRMNPVSERLVDVSGDKGKTNDVFVYGDLIGKNHIIYFGGDVQNYAENMEGNNARWVHWSTEKTADLLHSKFPSSLIFVIKPKQMHLKTFAVYSNFMDTNSFGCPLHSPGLGAIQHLNLVHKSAWQKVAEKCSIGTQSHVHDNQNTEKLNTKENGQCCNDKGRADEKTGLMHVKTQSGMFENISISIIGFSKGCVVLNQLVFELLPPELHNHVFDDKTKSYLARIKAIYWLDGGHSGGQTDNPLQHAWPTEPSKIKALTSLGCSIYIHVTPYQVLDPLRPWLGKQYRRFCQLLTSFGATFERKIHFEEEQGSLENHFKVLEVFKANK